MKVWSYESLDLYINKEVTSADNNNSLPVIMKLETGSGVKVTLLGM